MLGFQKNSTPGSVRVRTAGHCSALLMQQMQMGSAAASVQSARPSIDMQTMRHD